jgi:hypothetical protein
MTLREEIIGWYGNKCKKCSWGFNNDDFDVDELFVYWVLNDEKIEKQRCSRLGVNLYEHIRDEIIAKRSDRYEILCRRCRRLKKNSRKDLFLGERPKLCMAEVDQGGCGKIKDIRDFDPWPTMVDGVDYYCRECRKKPGLIDRDELWWGRFDEKHNYGRDIGKDLSEVRESSDWDGKYGPSVWKK